MKFTISRDAGAMLVDRVARPVNVSNLRPGIEVVYWDTEQQQGYIQWDEDTTVEINDRDLEAEEAQNRALRAENKRILEDPIYKKIKVHRPTDRITDFSEFMPFYNEWEAYVPPPPPPPDPDVQAKIDAAAADSADARAATLGSVQPMTIDQLKAMSRADLRTWFDANITNLNQLTRLVRWMFVYFLRRLL